MIISNSTKRTIARYCEFRRWSRRTFGKFVEQISEIETENIESGETDNLDYEYEHYEDRLVLTFRARRGSRNNFMLFLYYYDGCWMSQTERSIIQGRR